MSDPQTRGRTSFNPDDHELFRLVQARVAKKLSWDEIAAEIGCEVMPLCQWVNDYKYPPKPVVRAVQPIRAAGKAIHTPQQMSRQFEAWRRSQQGAAKTRAESA